MFSLGVFHSSGISENRLFLYSICLLHARIIRYYKICFLHLHIKSEAQYNCNDFPLVQKLRIFMFFHLDQAYSIFGKASSELAAYALVYSCFLLIYQKDFHKKSTSWPGMLKLR
jgi:hypothetical protein